MSGLPAIANWFAKNMDPLYERFHDKERRLAVQKQVDKIKDTGDLTKMEQIFNDAHIFYVDYVEFQKAMYEYDLLEQERHTIEERLSKRKTYGQRTGRQIGSFIAVVLASLVILIASYIVLS